MSSFPRNLQRKRARGKSDYAPQQYFEMLPCGGYRTIHPTRGWRSFTARRLAVQRKVAAILGRAA